MKYPQAGLLALVAITPMLGGCWAVAVGASSAVITSEFADPSTLIVVEGHNARELWSSARLTLSEMASHTIAVNDDTRMARGRYDGNIVTLQVATHDLNSVELRVQARKVGFVNAEVAKLVADRILDDLARRYPAQRTTTEITGPIEAAAR